MSTHDLPLASFLGKYQGRSSMERHRFAILGHTHECVIRIGHSHAFVDQAAGELPKAEMSTGETSKGRHKKICELLLIIESVGHVIEDFEILRKQIRRRFEVHFVECGSKLMNGRFNFFYAHRN